MMAKRDWRLQRIALPLDCRRIIRLGLTRDGNDPGKRIGGAHLRVPGRIYDLIYTPRFVENRH